MRNGRVRVARMGTQSHYERFTIIAKLLKIWLKSRINAYSFEIQNDSITIKDTYKMELETNQYHQLISRIGDLLDLGREKAAREVNTIMVQTYWEIGKYIVKFEQKGNEKAEYGSQLFERLSKDLTTAYGKGFSRSNLFYMRKIYLSFPISETLSHKLTWSHYFEILKADSEMEIGFTANKLKRNNGVYVN